MIIVGCDFHPSWQQVAIFDATTGETAERKLVNGSGEAEQFYRSLPVPSLVSVESSGNSQWFLDLVEQLGHEVWIGDAAQIRARYVRQQKTDRRDAGHILKLAAGRAVPAAVDPGCRAARPPSVADPSSSPGADSYAGEEWLAALGDESRDAKEV